MQFSFIDVMQFYPNIGFQILYLQLV